MANRAAGATRAAEAGLSNVVWAVNEAARRFGVRSAKRWSSSLARGESLVIDGSTTARRLKALSGVSPRCCSPSAPTVSDEPGDPWVHSIRCGSISRHVLSLGGEEATLFVMATRVRELGHRVRAAIADGPHLARVVATFAPTAKRSSRWSRAEQRCEILPLIALPTFTRSRRVVASARSFHGGGFVELPTILAGRLGERGAKRRPCAKGQDEAPLFLYEPPRSPTEDSIGTMESCRSSRSLCPPGLFAPCRPARRARSKRPVVELVAP